MIYLSPAIAVMALILGIFAYVSKNDKRLKIILFAQAILLASHYAMEGSISAAIITFTIAPLNLLAIFRNVKRLYPVFAVLVLAAGAIGFNGAQDIFPIAAVTLSLFALYNLDGIKMRMALMSCSMMWIIHDVAYDLPIILAMDIFLFLSNTIGIVRLIRDQQQIPRLGEDHPNAQALTSETS